MEDSAVDSQVIRLHKDAQQQQPEHLDDLISYKERRRRQNPDRKRHGARNQHKMKDFVRWLVATFPRQLDCSAAQAPILDVAGGKGELAARLCVCHQKKVILVDPRPSDPLLCFEMNVLPKLPKKWREKLLEKRKQSECQEEEHTIKESVKSTGVTDGSSISSSPYLQALFQERFQQLVMYFDHATLKTNDLHEAVRGSCLLVGMHADGATEAIVDAALQYNKPFCVVPCCVFPNLFPERRLNIITRQEVIATEEAAAKMTEPLHDTSSCKKQETMTSSVPVRTYEQFCEYLLQKDPRFQMTTLPFEGRNVAIWWDGKD